MCCGEECFPGFFDGAVKRSRTLAPVCIIASWTLSQHSYHPWLNYIREEVNTKVKAHPTSFYFSRSNAGEEVVSSPACAQLECKQGRGASTSFLKCHRIYMLPTERLLSFYQCFFRLGKNITGSDVQRRFALWKAPALGFSREKAQERAWENKRK